MMTKTQKAHAVTWTSARYRVKRHYAKSERAKKPEVQAATGQLPPLVNGKERDLQIQKTTKTRKAEKPSPCQIQADQQLKNEGCIG